MRIKTETSVGLFVLVALSIFLYMTFQIGVLRFDHGNYNDYILYFSDVSGLKKKSDVDIAGVKVGWVEAINLLEQGQQVQAIVRVLKEYKLYANAYGVIRQDGLLGTKYLEIIPGDPQLEPIKTHGTLVQPSKETPSVDTLLNEFHTISRNIHEITETLHTVVAGEEGKQRLTSAIENFNEATKSITQASKTCNAFIETNQDTIHEILANIHSITHDIKEELPKLSNDLRVGIDRIFTKCEETCEPIYQVAERVNRGEGVLGWFCGDRKKQKKTINNV